MDPVLIFLPRASMGLKRRVINWHRASRAKAFLACGLTTIGSESDVMFYVISSRLSRRTAVST